jgi:hypothetical protein
VAPSQSVFSAGVVDSDVEIVLKADIGELKVSRTAMDAFGHTSMRPAAASHVLAAMTQCGVCSGCASSRRRSSRVGWAAVAPTCSRSAVDASARYCKNPGTTVFDTIAALVVETSSTYLSPRQVAYSSKYRLGYASGSSWVVGGMIVDCDAVSLLRWSLGVGGTDSVKDRVGVPVRFGGGGRVEVGGAEGLTEEVESIGTVRVEVRVRVGTAVGVPGGVSVRM